MPLITIGFAESAVADLEDIKRWYREQDVPEGGERVIVKIFERLETLCDHQGIGRLVPEFDQEFLRELIQPPFRIIYRRELKQIRVVRVWRSERPLLQFPNGEESIGG
ncbi:MAG: type II toxin-antitoxin system RelE/ParE family toxin [Chromatiaceae bacterium]|nr:type II toxin-antitoxin system RelE/ParE family toxin [Chromatiaceae bacterium]